MVIASADFRRILGHFASGVTIVTTCDADKKATGLTANAFTSVSLEPPLVLVCIDHKSQSHGPLIDAGCFAVNILTVDQEAISRKFATTRLDKFEGIPYRVSPRGVPIIEGALACLECKTVSVHVEGDHTILVGRVEDACSGEGRPLLYFRGQYHRLRGEET
jgi:flavin reductase (DIM6/NTAB) family NADH-FMN oxidoreductase RutF